VSGQAVVGGVDLDRQQRQRDYVSDSEGDQRAAISGNGLHEKRAS
jgi:hypothetical protein